ncbi:hypothetical protein [Prescottella agglutinans]|uniref:Uncharacterized protein n=1 Tax=Prescottella agglutinans TaxID=1644129 RepID=A0ABT6MK83_9NOCA|nr:hypothetical protein [Prescottella agglutinans]MDH6284315.1 hypothetical protein [Prescottella agglutinans]
MQTVAQPAQPAGEQTVAQPTGAATAGRSKLTAFYDEDYRRWEVAKREFDSIPAWTFELTDDVHDWARGLMTRPSAQAHFNGETTMLLAEALDVSPRGNELERALFTRAIDDGVLIVPVPGFFTTAYATRDHTETTVGTGYGFIPDGFEELAVWGREAVPRSELAAIAKTGPDAVVAWMTAVIATFAEPRPHQRPHHHRPTKD